LVELHISDLGDPSTLSEAQRSLCSRASTIEVQLEQLEAQMSEGLDVDLDQYGRLAGHLRRYLETLGVRRNAKDATSSAVIEHFSRPIRRST
jgi:uncharacterized protein (UPF0548 family)